MKAMANCKIREESKFMLEAIAEELRNTQIRSDISQIELTKKAMLSRITVQSILYGRNFPHLEKLMIVCQALNVPMSSIIKAAEEKALRRMKQEKAKTMIGQSRKDNGR